MGTLLEKAENHKIAMKQHGVPTAEEIELAFAWLRGNITTTQVCVAYGTHKHRHTAKMYKIARSLKEAYRQGLLKIKD